MHEFDGKLFERCFIKKKLKKRITEEMIELYEFKLNGREHKSKGKF